METVWVWRRWWWVGPVPDPRPVWNFRAGLPPLPRGAVAARVFAKPPRAVAGPRAPPEARDRARRPPPVRRVGSTPMTDPEDTEKLLSSQKHKKRELVVSRFTLLGHLSPHVAKKAPFLLHGG